MQQIQQQINLYHTLFYVCLGICIFCFLLSVFFFFKFNIRSIFNARTGRSVKKTVQQVEEMNAHTGPLRRTAGRGSTETEPLETMGGTDVLAAGSTDVLNRSSSAMLTPEMAQQEVDESFGMFRIDKCMMFIHTDEVV